MKELPTQSVCAAHQISCPTCKQQDDAMLSISYDLETHPLASAGIKALQRLAALSMPWLQWRMTF
jgi:hypothetical protein